MVDMPDYAHPYAPNILANVQALQGYQNLTDQRQEQQDAAQAGQMAQSGDMDGASKFLLAHGHYDKAVQMQTMFRQANSDQLKDIAEGHEKLGNIAMLAKTPDDWNQALQLAQKHGLNTAGYEDFITGRSLALAMAKKADDYAKAESQKRVDELNDLKVQKAKQDLASPGEWKFGVTHEDPLQGKTYGFVNPETQEIRPIKPGAPAEPEEIAATPVSPSSSERIGPHGITGSLTEPIAVTSAMAPEERDRAQGLNPEALKDLSLGDANRVRAIQRGDEVIQQRDKIGQALMSRVYAFDPTFNKTDMEARKKFKETFMTANGKSNQNAVNYDTAIQHGLELAKNVDALPDTGVKPLNELRNWWSAQRTDPNISNFYANANVLAGEIAKVTHGGQSEAEHERILKTLDPGLGKEALGSVIAKYVHLLSGKGNAMVSNWKQNMGGQEFPREILSPESRAGAQTLLEKYGTPEEHAQGLQKARDAIARGASREDVIKRLEGLGIDPKGL